MFLIIIILATIPTSLATFRSFIGFPPPASLPTAEITALEFLRQQPEGVVLTQPYDSYASKPQTPIPLYLYQTSAYVSAFSHKISFLEDYMNLDITNYDWQNRKQQVDYFFSNPSSSETIGFLLNNQIDYIYLVNYYLPTNLANHTVSLIYDQAGIKIYKVLK